MAHLTICFCPVYVSESISQVYALHIFGLHLMIVGARCQEDLGSCTSADWSSAVITLYGCSLVRVSFLDTAVTLVFIAPPVL